MRFLALILAAFLEHNVLAGPQHAYYHRQDAAPYHRLDTVDLVPNKYVVKLYDHHTLDQHWAHIGRDLSVTEETFKYLEHVRMYVAIMDEHLVHDLVRKDPGVKYVHHAHYMELHNDTTVTGMQVSLDFSDSSHLARRALWTKEISKNNVPYPLVQISNNEILTTPVPDYERNYKYVDQSGAGVRVYVLDSGINFDSPIFDNRFDDEESRTFFGRGRRDEFPTPGHGTGVAANVLGPDIGTAPGAHIVNYKVSDGKTIEDQKLIDAINAVIADHKDFRGKNNAGKQLPGGHKFWRGSVINYSAGSHRGPEGFVEAVQDAIEDAKVAGIVFVTTAGNAPRSADQIYPCAYDGVICVGATDNSYKPAEFSGFGSKLFTWAPGESIVSINSADGKAVGVRGTSFAAPLVAGIAASIISIEYAVGYEEGKEPYVVDVVKGRIKENAVPDVSIPEAPNNNNPNSASPTFLAGTGVWAPGFYVNAPEQIVLPKDKHAKRQLPHVLPRQEASNSTSSSTTPQIANAVADEAEPSLPADKITSWVTETGMSYGSAWISRRRLT